MPRVRPKYELCVGFDEEDVSENEDGGDEGGDVGEEGEFDIQQVWQQMKQEAEDRTRAKENQTARAGAIQENNKKAKQRSSFLNWKQKIQVSNLPECLFFSPKYKRLGKYGCLHISYNLLTLHEQKTIEIFFFYLTC